MGKEDLRRREPQDSRGVVRRLQSIADRARIDRADHHSLSVDEVDSMFRDTIHPDYKSPGAEATEIVLFPQARECLDTKDAIPRK